MSLSDSRTVSTLAVESLTTSSRSTSVASLSPSVTQNPGVESTTRTSIRSTSDPLLSTSHTNGENSSRSTVVTTTTSRMSEPMSSPSASGTSGSPSTSKPNVATASGSENSGSQSPSPATSRSSLSGSTSSAATTSLLTSVVPSPTSINPPSTTSAPSGSRTTITPSPTFDISASSQSTSSIKPNTTATSYSSATPTASQTAAFPAVTHNVIFDLGTCADAGLPKIMSNRDGSLSSLLTLEDGRYSAILKMTESVGSEFVIFLADSGERCGQDGSCTSLILWFDPNLLDIQVSRAGDRGLNMYPLSMWVDGGALFDGTPAGSQASKYDCWGWPIEDCPFSYMYFGDPASTLSSVTPNSTIYVTFCPPDGPALSSIGPNPNPPEIIPIEHGTAIIIGTGTTVPVSTFWTPITSHKAPGGASPTSSLTSMDEAALSAYCKTMVIPACIKPQTFLPIDETTTVPIGRPLYATLLTTTVSGVVGPVTITPTASSSDYGPPEIFPTFFGLSTTTVVPISTVTPTRTPTRPREGSSPLMTATPTVVTDTLAPPDATPTVLAATVPTFSVVTDSRGSAVYTFSSDLVTTIPPPSPTSPPQTFYTLTQWTTYSSVNGTTIPIVGGQVGVLTTVPVTYVLEPSTTIPVQVLSSISAQSTRTSLPSVSADAETVRSGTSEESKVAAAVAGSLVGLTLLSLLVWTVCFRRKRARRSADYAAHRTPMWSTEPGAVQRSGSEEGSELDLDGGEARPHDSFVEPWVVPHSQAQGSGSSTSRKMQREMEEYGGGLFSASVGAGPSRSRTGASSSVGNSYGALRSAKSANRVPQELQPEPLARWPVRTNTLSSIHSSGSSLLTPVSGPTPTRPPLAPVETQPDPSPPRRRYSDEQRQENAIPPRYNEAWNIQISPSTE